MKLHKANTNGSLSLTLPKDLLDLLKWKEKDDITILETENEYEMRMINRSLRARKENK